MRILVESMYDISLKDNDKILCNSAPDINKKNKFVENLYKQLFIDIKNFTNKAVPHFMLIILLI